MTERAFTSFVAGAMPSGRTSTLVGRAPLRRPPAGSGRRRRSPGGSEPGAPAKAPRSTGAIPPVIGSPSLNATSSGVVAAVSAAHAARLASDAGSSGAVGTRSGMARGPAW